MTWWQSLAGKWIVLEGIDGAGTTTQCAELAKWLRGLGMEVHETREPSAGPLGQLLRQQLSQEKEPLSWASMALLFAADRCDHVFREIGPARDRRAVVICDRFDLSSLIYQYETGPQEQGTRAWLRALNSRVPRPDFTAVLQISAEQAQERRSRRGGPEELYERLELQRRLAAQYESASALLPEDYLVSINACPAPEQVQAALRTAIGDWVAMAAKGSGP